MLSIRFIIFTISLNVFCAPMYQQTYFLTNIVQNTEIKYCIRKWQAFVPPFVFSTNFPQIKRATNPKMKRIFKAMDVQSTTSYCTCDKWL